eukprot:TRINITY_DN17384_c0_g1_i1.p1 TRINITY_DN17384_c0_g1~~TRINITY_DN17384_c0_g1_i1.p1  ORF type:complete len:309 (+),score=38.48 TRINITY_DN17384_c0_g1_i1:42-929(+)
MAPREAQKIENHIPVKVNAFRQFASQLAAQVTEQLCAEFEREVSLITEELVVYRTELARCGELLAHQLGREKQLHSMLENIAGNTGSLASSAADIGHRHASQESTKAQMHEMVEQMFGHSTSLVNTTMSGVNEAHHMAHSHLAQARELQNQSISAENELNRIMNILGVAPVEAITPRPTSGFQGQNQQEPTMMMQNNAMRQVSQPRQGCSPRNPQQGCAPGPPNSCMSGACVSRSPMMSQPCSMAPMAPMYGGNCTPGVPGMQANSPMSRVSIVSSPHASPVHTTGMLGVPPKMF